MPLLVELGGNADNGSILYNINTTPFAFQAKFDKVAIDRKRPSSLVVSDMKSAT